MLQRLYILLVKTISCLDNKNVGLVRRASADGEESEKGKAKPEGKKQVLSALSIYFSSTMILF